MNPSHAAESQADKTVNRLIQASAHHGYSGWIMLSLYPERSPKPSQLSSFDPSLSAQNCAAIERELLRHGITEVLGAWGNMPHRTLKRAKVNVQALLNLRISHRPSLHCGRAQCDTRRRCYRW